MTREKEQMVRLYTNMVRARKLDQAVVKGIAEGKTEAFFHSGQGEEAVRVQHYRQFGTRQQTANQLYCFSMTPDPRSQGQTVGPGEQPLDLSQTAQGQAAVFPHLGQRPGHHFGQFRFHDVVQAGRHPQRHSTRPGQQSGIGRQRRGPGHAH